MTIPFDYLKHFFSVTNIIDNLGRTTASSLDSLAEERTATTPPKIGKFGVYWLYLYAAAVSAGPAAATVVVSSRTLVWSGS